MFAALKWEGEGQGKEETDLKLEKQTKNFPVDLNSL